VGQQSLLMAYTLPYALFTVGFVLALTPHLLAQTIPNLDVIVLSIPKVLAPPLIFAGLAVHIPANGDEVHPPSAVLIMFAIGVGVLIWAAFALSRVHATPIVIETSTPNSTTRRAEYRVSLPSSELIGMCDSTASKAILVTHALLLFSQRIGPWVR